MKQIILASNNEKKIIEMQKLLDGFNVISLKEAGVDVEIEENGTTFIENALIKSTTAHKLTGKISIADDSGLVIDALDGRPGIYSARYAEPGQRINKVLSEMKDIPYEKRTAHFVCAIACTLENGESFTIEEKCDGIILNERRGTGGMGYDPIFYYPELDQTFAQISLDKKNLISHRGKAMRKFMKEFKNKLN